MFFKGFKAKRLNRNGSYCSMLLDMPIVLMCFSLMLRERNLFIPYTDAHTLQKAIIENIGS